MQWLHAVSVIIFIEVLAVAYVRGSYILAICIQGQMEIASKIQIGFCAIHILLQV
jgi:hypothetical protein